MAPYFCWIPSGSLTESQTCPAMVSEASQRPMVTLYLFCFTRPQAFLLSPPFMEHLSHPHLPSYFLSSSFTPKLVSGPLFCAHQATTASALEPLSTEFPETRTILFTICLHSRASRPQPSTNSCPIGEATPQPPTQSHQTWPHRALLCTLQGDEEG